MFRGNSAAPVWPCSWTLHTQSLVPPWICREEWREWVFVFSQVFFLVGTTTKTLQLCSQAGKPYPGGAELCQSAAVPPSTPNSAQQSLCPGGSFDFPPKQNRLHHYHREMHSNIRLGGFFWRGGSACLCPPDSTGGPRRKRISYAVISCNRWPHQNYGPCWWTFGQLF